MAQWSRHNAAERLERAKIELRPPRGRSGDVSEDFAAFDAADNLGEDTKRFINRHINTGEKRAANSISAR
jgi:hypothetical protein